MGQAQSVQTLFVSWIHSGLRGTVSTAQFSLISYWYSIGAAEVLHHLEIYITSKHCRRVSRCLDGNEMIQLANRLRYPQNPSIYLSEEAPRVLTTRLRGVKSFYFSPGVPFALANSCPRRCLPALDLWTTLINHFSDLVDSAGFAPDHLASL